MIVKKPSTIHGTKPGYLSTKNARQIKPKTPKILYIIYPYLQREKANYQLKYHRYGKLQDYKTRSKTSVTRAKKNPVISMLRAR